jgi:hypothetical protein
MVDKVVKFLGGNIKLRSAVQNKINPQNGAMMSWTQAISIEVGKSKLALGKDFLKKLNELASDEANREFFQTLPE